MPLFDLFWSMLWFFLFIAWIWVLISVLSDIFRNHDMSGFVKAIWVLFVIVIPWLGVLIYLIVNGDSMNRRTVEEAQKREAAAQDYIRQAAGTTSVADELEKLGSLKSSGVISEEEFQAQKARLLG